VTRTFDFGGRDRDPVAFLQHLIRRTGLASTRPTNAANSSKGFVMRTSIQEESPAQRLGSVKVVQLLPRSMSRQI
jgi:hypothetical protein